MVNEKTLVHIFLKEILQGKAGESKKRCLLDKVYAQEFSQLSQKANECHTSEYQNNIRKFQEFLFKKYDLAFTEDSMIKNETVTFDLQNQLLSCSDNTNNLLINFDNNESHENSN